MKPLGSSGRLRPTVSLSKLAKSGFKKRVWRYYLVSFEFPNAEICYIYEDG